jgi:SulP family sulfate permease
VVAAQEAHWLLGPFPAVSEGGIALPGVAALRLLDGPALRLMLPFAASASLLSVLSVMLWTTGNELDSRRTLRLDWELGLSGAANVVGGLLGGLACGQGYSTTTILRKQGAMTRTAALVPAAGALALALAGPAVLGLIPRFVVASLLLSTGFDWLVLRPAKDLPTLPRREAASVVAVAAAVIWAGMVLGVLAGLGLALVLFALGYARTPVIRAALPRSACRSTFVRPVEAENLLVQAGDAILLCRLQGHVFFLNASEIPTALARRPKGALRHVILDFHDVAGVDSSVHPAFERLRQIGIEQGFRLLLCGMSPEVGRQFRGRGLLREPLAPGVASFGTADAALQDAEECVLREAGLLGPDAGWSLGDQLGRMGGDAVPEARLAPYLRVVSLSAGEAFVRQGDAADAMYFLTAGIVATQLDGASGAPPLRLHTAGSGAVIGEVGMLCTGARTASVVAEAECAALVLTAEALGRMERDDPALATLLYRFLLREVASKLAGSTRLIEMQAR